VSLSIAHLSFSRTGGAGSVAAILTEAQKQAGHHSRHVWGIDSNLWSQPLAAPLHSIAAGIDHYVVRNHHFAAPISVLRDSQTMAIDSQIRDADVLHLHSVNGVINVGALAERYPEKKIVWTLHDMNPMTGACHYSLGCEKFTTTCSQCPAVRRSFQPLVEKRFFAKKTSLHKIRNLHLVAPSSWLAEAASRSALLQGFPLSVIPNPVNLAFTRESANSPVTFTFCVVAQKLDDEVKNVAAAILAFERVRKHYPTITLALIGRGGASFAKPGVSVLGVLSPGELASVLGTTRALVVPSRAENSPLAVAEAAAMGCLPLVHEVGGMPAMLHALGAGHTFSEPAELDELMERCASEEISHSMESRALLAETARSLYSPEAVAWQYDGVYER